MKIALLGYGKMGKEIESIAGERGHEITLKITSDNVEDLNHENLQSADIAIEFSRPEHAVENMKACFEAGLPIVVGTTGWYDQFVEIQDLCKESQGSLLHATNFSVGVNIFFELNKALAHTMQKFDDYRPSIDETHHTQKLDAPSGTAITLAEGILDSYKGLTAWKCNENTTEKDLEVKAHRIENVPGTHEITYESEIDNISIKHEAKSRKGFALGAVVAAEWLQGKVGVYTMSDVLKVNFS